MKRLVLLVLVSLALLALWWRLRPSPGGPGASDTVESVLARERAAAYFAEDDLAAARAALAALVAGPDAPLEDLVRAAAVEAMDRASGDPEPLFARIRARDPENPALHYMLARRSLEAGDFEGALAHFWTVLARRPDDLAARVGLGATLADLQRTDEAREQLTAVVERGIEHAGSWYVQAVYRLVQLAERAGPPEEAERLGDLFQQLTDLGYRSASAAELDRGTLAGVAPPAPGGVEGIEEAEPGRMPAFTAEPALLAELAGARVLEALDLDGDGDVDFLAAGPRGVQVALRGAQGLALEDVLAGPVDDVCALDLGNRDVLDLLAVRGAELVLLEHRSGAELLLAPGEKTRWTRSPLALPVFPAEIEDLAPVDFDHDGDLDVLLAGAFGARLLRNDGAAPRVDAQGVVTRGSFVDASLEASLPRDVALAWCLTEDFDGDHDVDLLLGGAAALSLMDGRRAGRFEDVGARVFGQVPGMEHAPLVADVDGDARPDLLERGSPARLWRQGADGSFALKTLELDLPGRAAAALVDLDLDGTLDLFRASEGAVAEGVLGLERAVERAGTVDGPGAPGAPLVFADLDLDLDLDLARVTAAGLEVFRCDGPVGHAARIELVGLKDNRRGIGAVVEARTRGLYRRIYWRGGGELVGSGPHAALDVVRTTWPNGGVQTELDVAPAGGALLDTAPGRMQQSDALIGSCPFLYAWNGRTFGFVSDVLGVTPLGLPIGPGKLVPPDHDELVLVRGDQLVPRDGRLELQLTEELREVTYLDRVRLDVVDHPAGTEIYPNERFTFPPFPEPHVHSVRAPLAPRVATGSDGRDWTSALRTDDDVHAQPFEPLEPQFLGLATPHWLELEFDPERVRAAPRLRLVCTGWFFWTDASVNMASARTPGVAFVPPTLELPGQGGAWHAAGAPLGFPAGKSKTMVIELGELLDRERPRLRLASTLRLYWDSIRLAVDADDALLVTTSLEPASAHLWPRGFSQPLATGRKDLPERFDWERLAPHKRWNPHPGRYTRYGETLPLVQAIDDRFVILASGDALALDFDASACPPLRAGWVRDYLLFLDGWAKDRDPNTLEALQVEPLPFHGMSGYPYGADEAFPADELHATWRREWNTREAQAWIVPLSPRREAEWLAELAGAR